MLICIYVYMYICIYVKNTYVDTPCERCVIHLHICMCVCSLCTSFKICMSAASGIGDEGLGFRFMVLRFGAEALIRPLAESKSEGFGRFS